MKSAAYVSISQQMVLGRRMDAIAQNLANLNTPAFKGERLLFEEYLHTAEYGQPISYVHEVSLERDMTGGPLDRTGNDLDVALDGPGWFVIGTDEEDLYTRQGHFQVDGARRIVNSSGDPLLNQNGDPFTLGAQDTSITIGSDGTVSSDSGPLGRIKVVDFEDEIALAKVGPGLFANEDDNPPIDLGPEEVTIEQGAIEMSNIQPILEVTRMIDVMRSYQKTQRMVQTGHDLQRRTIQDITSTS